MGRLEEPMYDSDTGAPINQAAFELGIAGGEHCDHWTLHNDSKEYLWCHQCQRWECPKCQHEEI